MNIRGLVPTTEAPVSALVIGEGAVEGPHWTFYWTATSSAESSALRRVFARAMNSAFDIVVRAMISASKQNLDKLIAPLR